MQPKRHDRRQGLETIGLAILLHAAILGALSLSIDEWLPEPTPLLIDADVIQAMVVDQDLLDAEMDKVAADEQEPAVREAEAQAEQQQRREELQRQQALEEERREAEAALLARQQEQQRLEEQRLAEEAALRAEQARLEAEQAARRAREEEERRLAAERERLERERLAEQARQEAIEVARLEREREMRRRVEEQMQLEAERRQREAEARERAEQQRLAEERRRKRERERLARRLRNEARNIEQRQRELQFGAVEHGARIQAHVQSFWFTPADLSRNLSCMLSITLDQNGNVTSVRVTRGSGDRSFDLSAVAAVRRASPLPVPSNPGLTAQFRAFNLNFCPTCNS